MTLVPAEVLARGRLTHRTNFVELKQDLDRTVESELVRAIEGPPKPTGRRPYDREPMVRALYAHHFMGVANTIVDLHWMLVHMPAFRVACGFTGENVPSRPTFSRVYTQMTSHIALIEEKTEEVLDEIKEYLPELGEEIAVDSTVVETHANPNRSPHSDPDAGRTVVHSARSSRGKSVYGYKAHTAVDANHDIPLVMSMTPANRHDTTHLRTLMKKVWKKGHEPSVVIADRGYDKGGHSRWLHRNGVAPVIHKRTFKSKVHRKKRPLGSWAVYSTEGFPLCECGHVRPYIRTDPETGRHLYGRVAGCRRGGSLPPPVPSYCDYEVWVDPDDDPWLFGGKIRRGSREWKRMYRKRWSVERVFARWKENGCLGRHYFRGKKKIELHIRLAMLTYLVRVLRKLEKAQMQMAA